MPATHGTRRNGLVALLCAVLLPGCGESEAPPHLRIEGADASRGRALVADRGCATCHVVQGIRGSRGMTGPPILDWAQRTTLAGQYPNNPPHLIAWLMNPPAMRPGTAMPNIGLSAEEARHIAAYLYTLGASGVQIWPPDPPIQAAPPGLPTLDRIERSTEPLARGVGRP
jgi:cytochrome c2